MEKNLSKNCYFWLSLERQIRELNSTIEEQKGSITDLGNKVSSLQFELESKKK